MMGLLNGLLKVGIRVVATGVTVGPAASFWDKPIRMARVLVSPVTVILAAGGHQGICDN